MAEHGTDEAWIAGWLDRVACGRAAMSQRTAKSIARRGGLVPLVEAARRRGIHLVQLTDDRGIELVAASRHAFKVIC